MLVMKCSRLLRFGSRPSVKLLKAVIGICPSSPESNVGSMFFVFNHGRRGLTRIRRTEANQGNEDCRLLQRNFVLFFLATKIKVLPCLNPLCPLWTSCELFFLRSWPSD